VEASGEVVQEKAETQGAAKSFGFGFVRGGLRGGRGEEEEVFEEGSCAHRLAP